jgi:hypothetical protein
MKQYQDFLEKKRHLLGDFGFTPNYFPEIAFDFQIYNRKSSS